MVGGFNLAPSFISSTQENLLLSYQIALSQKIDTLMPDLQAALLKGMLLGEQSQLPTSFKIDLKITSTIHMVVVSGQNLTILAAFVMTGAKFLGRKKTAAITLLVIALYAALTGFGTPVIRAAIMSSLTYLSWIFGRERSAVWTLLVSAAIMLLFDPNYLFNISFQLSFLATTGVIVVAPILNSYLIFIPEVIRNDFSTTIAAQVLTFPIIAYNFGTVSIVGVIANIFLLWTVPIIMIVGGVALFLSYINLALAQIIGLIPSILLTYFIYIVEIFSKMPLASIKLLDTNVFVWIGYYCLISGLFMVLLRNVKAKAVN